ncbi:hypothetical protein [uncultured Slackia sp.]|jgi:hypothetical protein|uniref:hypothetical protein n=1 Tax=uncultured Slackia sp. TaxID=665903 RepID=UPI0025ED1E0A|nr:hypothetical protein [uncultured Slackia sp.]
MSGARKALKIMSILTIVMAIIQIITAGLIVFGSSFMVGMQEAELDGTTVDVGVALMGVGIMALVSSVVSLIVGILGVRGANDPTKIGPYKIIAIIGLVLCILQAAMFLFTGQIASYGISGVLSLVFVAVLVFLAFKIEKEGKQA